MSTNYGVIFEEYAERHYIKNFEKKYKSAWNITRRAITEEFKRFDGLFETSIAETIIDGDDIKICKTEFRVAGTKDSRKSSGNRCITALCREDSIYMVRVLLVYHKNDIKGGNETARWKQIIKENYPEYKKLL